MLNLSITYIYIDWYQILRNVENNKTIEICSTHTIIFINFQECI